jgi:HSP20 family protein
MQVVESATRDASARSPAMEIIEEPAAFVLSCELSSAQREDIRVDVSPHRCVVACLPRAPIDHAIRGAKEAPYQEFERAVPLPSEVDPEGAEARLNNGVLEVFLPKKKIGGQGVYRLPAL